MWTADGSGYSTWIYKTATYVLVIFRHQHVRILLAIRSRTVTEQIVVDSAQMLCCPVKVDSLWLEYYYTIGFNCVYI